MTVEQHPTQITLPALAIRDVIVFPYSRSPIFMGRDKSIAAADLARDQYDSQIILITQTNAKVDDPQQEDLYSVGTLARVEQLLRLPDGTVKALVYGLERYKVKRVFEEKGSLFAECEILEVGEPSEKEKSLYLRALMEVWRAYAEMDRAQLEVYNKYKDVDDLEQVVGLVLSSAKFNTAEKAELLVEPSWAKRVERLTELFEREVQLRDIQQRIDSRVKRQMEKNQREYFLNEQIKAIRKELAGGEDSPEEENAADEYKELAERIAKAKLPKKVEATLRQELKRLRQMPAMSSEATVVRSYLDTMLDIPWSEKSRISRDLARAAKILDEDHSGLEKVKERILEYLAVQKRVGKVKSPILCLVGAPGVGKTSLGESIARATGRKYVRVALGGVHDESEIRGHRRTYIGSMPGQIIKGMIRAGVKNPLFLLDEIDKMGMDYRGDPSAALLEVLDPEQNSTFQDHYVEETYDLSDVMFVATSNSYNIPGPLLDRMEVISLSGYTEEEKLHIARNHLLPKQLKLNGLKPAEVDFTDEAILDIVRYYTREAGVRGLERSIGKVLRKIVLKTEQEAAKPQKLRRMKGTSVKKQVTKVTSENLGTFLGVRRYTVEYAKKDPRIGVVNGLAWTSVGGDLLNIEAQTFPGKGHIQSTGSLGDVMKESVQTARSVVRSRARELGIENETFYSTDLHVHFPDGATPKDGPSAGAATTTAIVSVMTKIPVRSDIAMTGEINLHGEVLQIGGLKEKLLAAVRAGCKTVLIPKDNVRDLEDMPETVEKSLRIVLVTTIDEVLKEALVEMPKPLPEKKEEKKADAEKASDVIPPKKSRTTKRKATVNAVS